MIPTVTSPSEIFAAILESYRVTNAVIDSLDLIETYKAKSRKRAISRVRKHRDVAVTSQGLVEVKYEDRDRMRAAEVANAFVHELDTFNREMQVTSARRVSQFIATRIQQAG